jgi:hypothetical protein
LNKWLDAHAGKIACILLVLLWLIPALLAYHYRINQEGPLASLLRHWLHQLGQFWP